MKPVLRSIGYEYWRFLVGFVRAIVRHGYLCDNAPRESSLVGWPKIVDVLVVS